jgi:hypothetical protein
MAPLVSVIMPTGGRRILALRAVDYFNRYAPVDAELVVVDSGPRFLFNGEVPPRVVYLRVPMAMTLGEALNTGIHASHGSIISRQDDDDWYGEDYLDKALSALASSSNGLAMIGYCYEYDIFTRNARDRVGWGGTLIFTREVWERTPFPHQRLREDADFFLEVEKVSGKEAVRYDGASTHVKLAHRKNVTGPMRAKENSEAVRVVKEVMGSDLDWYEAFAEMTS